MVRFLIDENFNAYITKSLRSGYPDVDVVTVQELGLGGADDPAILEYAAQNARMVLTHDIRTMPEYLRQRVESVNQQCAGDCTAVAELDSVSGSRRNRHVRSLQLV